MRARIVAVFAALVLVIAAPWPALADTPGPAVFGPETLTQSVGNGPSAEKTRCPTGSVLTGIRVTLPGSAPGAAALVCRAVQVEAGQVSLGAESSVPIVGAPAAGGASVSTSCPVGDVVDGLAVTDRYGSITSGRVSCRTLRPDGTLSTTASQGSVVGAPAASDKTTKLSCPTGAVSTGLAAAADSSFAKISVAVRCQGLYFPSITPADYNLTWPTALTVGANSTTPGAITAPGQDRWYRFPVQPGGRVSVDLTDLPADYDVTLFKDIEQAFTDLSSTTDLNKLSAEFAGDAFAPSVFSPSVFSPSVFSPSVFSPSVFSPSVFSPSVFSPSVFSPSVFSPSVFSPSVFSPSVFSPSVFSPSVFSPSVFSPSVFSPSVFSPSVFSEAFGSAQTRSLIGFSSRDGTAAENISSDTWNNTGYFYVRVQGRNGVSSPTPYSLKITSTAGSCSSPLDAHANDATVVGTSGSAETVILTDPGRLPGSAADRAALATELSAFATRVNGVVVDLGTSTKINNLNAQADSRAFVSCPYAKNLVAQAARDIVNSYRDTAGTLKYVVIVGGDAVVPFFRYPDTAGLGPESDFVPPVANDTASNASLRGNYVLGQDAYGAESDLSIKGTTLPVPDLAVGRLVESPNEISSTLEGFLARNGTPLRPTSTLATGYDFLTDAADAVAAEFAAGTPGGRHDTLITDADVPPNLTTQNNQPSRRRSWTADDLRRSLFGSRHDLVYLAGHFSANNTLAADYATTVRSNEVAAASADLFNDTLILSAGCHSGYTIVDGDGVPGVTDGLDWTEAFAQKGATLVAGTGYQYGDTDFLEYSERLYADFARQLRRGTGPVPPPVAVGQALVQAKQNYLETTPTLAGIDQKAVLEATLYGLPMLGVDLPGRASTPSDPSVATPTAVGSGPGSVLGLQSDDLELSPTLDTVSRTLTNLDGGTVAATYLKGPDGVSTGPAEPALPLDSSNVTVSDHVLRGVGLRSATYTDKDGITPLTGAPATETHGVHTPFVTPAFYPGRLATVNYFDALGAAGSSGTTRLMLTPAQHRSDATGSLTDTLRQYSAVGLRLFYSDNLTTYTVPPVPGRPDATNTPALAAPPTLTGVAAEVSGSTVTFQTQVVGDPSAGIQQVWVTYTGQRGTPFHGRWESVDLTQDPNDSTRWTGTLTLPAGQNAADVRYQVQAVNGVGLIGSDDNQGTYFTPGVTVGAPDEDLHGTALTPTAPVPSSGDYGDAVRVGTRLTDTVANAPLAGRLVTFAVGASSRTVLTDSSGLATTDLPLSVDPGSYQLVASYDGDATTAASSTPGSAFTVGKQATTLSLTTSASSATATLHGRADLPLREKTVYFGYLDAGGAVLAGRAVTTDRLGNAVLDLTDRPAAAVSLRAWFGVAAAPVPGGQTADLTDPTYRPSGPATVTLPPVASVAQPDSYTTPQGVVLTVPKPGVLANDTVTAGGFATLVSGPASGTLTLKQDGSFTYTPTATFAGTASFSYKVVNGSVSSQPAIVTIAVMDATPRGCTILGTQGNDTLKGTARNDVICGLGGNDTIAGGDGNDLIYGGSGDDNLSGGNGIDVIIGGAGADKINGDASSDVVTGGDGNDTVTGGTGADALSGNSGNDTLSGGDSDDLVIGGSGTDQLNGDAGADFLDARDGASGDRVDGGAGTRDAAIRDTGDMVTGIP